MLEMAAEVKLETAAVTYEEEKLVRFPLAVAKCGDAYVSESEKYRSPAA
jgi:hypothetical protein